MVGNEVSVYTIRVHGHLGSTWSEWFAGLHIRCEPKGVTLISGPIVDQTALHGLLAKIRDLGLTLLSVTKEEEKEEEKED